MIMCRVTIIHKLRGFFINPSHGAECFLQCTLYPGTVTVLHELKVPLYFMKLSEILGIVSLHLQLDSVDTFRQFCGL